MLGGLPLQAAREVGGGESAGEGGGRETACRPCGPFGLVCKWEDSATEAGASYKLLVYEALSD